MTHTITLQPSGHSFEVEPGESILRAGQAAGYAIPFSCRQGVCSTCRGKIVEGQVDLGEVHPAYLSEADRAAGFAHLCQASALSDVTIEIRELEGLAGVKVRKVPCRVSKVEQAASDVTILHLRLPMNENMMFVAGQHIELILPGDVRRCYSIASKPSVDGVTALELHIRRMPGGLFTDGLLPKLKERELMRFEGPLGTFSLRENSTKAIVFVASGTGFSAIKAMAEHAFARGIHTKRPIHLYWGGRIRQDIYHAALAESWAKEFPGFHFVPVLSEATPACAWSGRTGFVHNAVMEDFPTMKEIEVYACGAPMMVEAARRDFIQDCGLAEDSFFADAFLSQADLSNPEATAAAS
ncbi:MULTISPECIES: CDP-6-deoxy-delta-3,4-glucoseen reductase [unclassified Beijerinckia]|uniref:CDP-6-deoxy-delta-3,4-glucoseen reductase n=1 Tax=unclassified Beijerinckia TaxID=2638183 RepID=UPI00089B144A|nr:MULTISPECIES: CDP-6-deoxy-delta-3,4-glucoseen reductase [unclassified Beijerinckia]MDH7796061.1 CDP-4-dehydro-6-deoxyglucose reductase [Beijerinckia sp. GAS462]SEC28549.1 CDP-4-dehydro-6-deoxyglucose reductase [Beijerinckia sp. 28-YEA-48]